MEPSAERQFFNLYNHGFIRVAVCIPEVKVADVPSNVASTIMLAKQASANNAILALFPELGISAYSNEDLFHQDALLTAVIEGLREILQATRELNTILVVGAPLRVDFRLFNCGIVIYRGRIERRAFAFLSGAVLRLSIPISIISSLVLKGIDLRSENSIFPSAT